MWPEKNNRYRPRVVFAYVDSAHAALCGRLLRRQGWELHLATSGEQAHQLVHAIDPQVVVLDTNLPDESGWLTCSKIRLEDQERRIVLLAADRDAQTIKQQEFVGASGLVARSEGPEALLGEIMGPRLAQAV